MGIVRVLQYAKLLSQGASEFWKITVENLKRKNFELNQLKAQPFAMESVAQRLIPVIQQNLQVCRRAKRWLDSKEKKVALELLADASDIVQTANIAQEIQFVLQASKKEKDIVDNLLYLYEEQEQLIQNVTKARPEEFIKELEGKLRKENKLISSLGVLDRDASDVKARFMPLYNNAEKMLSQFSKAAFAATAANPEDLSHLLNPANPLNPYNPLNPVGMWKQLNPDIIDQTQNATQTIQEINLGNLEFVYWAFVGVMGMILVVVLWKLIDDVTHGKLSGKAKSLLIRLVKSW